MILQTRVEELPLPFQATQTFGHAQKNKQVLCLIDPMG